MMLGGEAEAGRLLVGSVDWPTSNSFPSAWKETQGSVDGGNRGGRAVLTIGRGTPPGNSTRAFPRRGHPGRGAFTRSVPACCAREHFKKALPGKQLCPKPGSGTHFVSFQEKSWQESHCQQLCKIPGNLKMFSHFRYTLNYSQHKHKLPIG